MSCNDFLTIVSLSRTGSTNSHIKRNLTDFSPHMPCFVLAERQSGGRGRDGRVWDSPPGGFYGSLVQEIPGSSPLSYGLLSLLAGLGVREALGACLPRQTLDLKWPNDILCQGRKLAGILVENQIRGPQWLSIWGIGINLDRRDTPFSGELGRRAVSLDELGGLPVSRTQLALRLYERFSHWLEIWAAGRLPTVMAALESASRAFVGQTIAVHDRGELCRGVFERIDDQGGLLLRQEDGRSRICYSGEITAV